MRMTQREIAIALAGEMDMATGKGSDKWKPRIDAAKREKRRKGKRGGK